MARQPAAPAGDPASAQNAKPTRDETRGDAPRPLGALAPHARRLPSRVRHVGVDDIRREGAGRDFDPDDGEAANINVVVRCRGRNEREVKENSHVAVKTEGHQGQDR